MFELRRAGEGFAPAEAWYAVALPAPGAHAGSPAFFVDARGTVGDWHDVPEIIE